MNRIAGLRIDNRSWLRDRGRRTGDRLRADEARECCCTNSAVDAAVLAVTGSWCRLGGRDRHMASHHSRQMKQAGERYQTGG